VPRAGVFHVFRTMTIACLHREINYPCRQNYHARCVPFSALRPSGPPVPKAVYMQVILYFFLFALIIFNLSGDIFFTMSGGIFSSMSAVI
jgi:hypothetical protein